MKFEINRLEMLEAAKNAARVAPSKGPVDALSRVLVEGDDDSADIFLTATNFEISIQHKLKASISEKGSALIDARLLVGMLSLLGGDFVTFSAEKPEILKVVGGSTVYTINCLSPSNYPKPVMPFPEDAVKISGICTLAKKTTFAVSKDQNDSVLQCVNVKLKQNALHAAACDKSRMMLVKGEAESPDSQEFLLPGRSLQTLASISTDADVYDVSDMDHSVVFVKENMLFSMRKLPGTYMDVNMIVKSVMPAFSAIAEAKEIRNALELIAVCAGSQPVNLTLASNEIRLVCDGEAGASRASINANIASETPADGFYYDIEKLKTLFQIMDGKIKIELDKKGMMLVKSRSEVYFQIPRQKPKEVKTEKTVKTKEAA